MPSSSSTKERKSSKKKRSSPRSSSRSSPKKEKTPKENAALRSLVQKRLIQDVFQASSAIYSGWMVLVVDKPAMRVISSALGMYDIMEKHVTIVEDLKKKRAPFPDMGVIYLLACNEDSINRLIDDFQGGKKPLYGDHVFVYTLGRISDKYLEKIKECRPLLKRLKGLSEINIDFLVKESCAFHLDMRSAFAPIYVRNKRSKIENRLAEKLVTLCATMNELPHVRFPNDSATASTLARTFHVKMEQFARNKQSFWYHGDAQHTDRERATLMILDRRDDCLSPLMHDFTYQAMLNDLLPIDEDRITYVPDSTNNRGYYDDSDDESEDEEDETKRKAGAVDVLLNENDAVWVELRGQHIAKVIETLSARIQEMVNSDTHKHGKIKTGKEMTLSEMANALKALPEYKEVMSKLSQHMHLAHECMEKFQSEGLMELSELEQTLATGKTEDGRSMKVSEMTSKAVSTLKGMRRPSDRFRLLLIMIVSQGGIKSSDRDKLFKAARVTADQEKALDNLAQYLDLRIFNEGEDASGSKTKKYLSKMFGETVSGNANYDEESEYANSRYIPPMKLLLESLIQGSLSFDDYPSVVPMPQQIAGSSSGTAQSARKRRPEGSARRGGATDRWQRKEAASASAGADRFEGGRVIVFVVGGMCFSELRVTREVMAQENKEIVAGSTCFLKPSDFIEDFSNMA